LSYASKNRDQHLPNNIKNLGPHSPSGENN